MNNQIDQYIADNAKNDAQRKMFESARAQVHKLWPNLDERISWAMPGFFPNKEVSANHPLVFMKINKNWLGLYALPQFNEDEGKYLDEQGLKYSKGTIQIPYDYSLEKLNTLLEKIVAFNGQDYK